MVRDRFQPIDSAALAAAATAASLPVFLEPGPFVPINGILGFTLLFVLFGYEFRRTRKGLQHLAFGAVCGLCSLLVIASIAEFARGGWHPDYYVCLAEKKESRVSPWDLLWMWGVGLAIFTVISGFFPQPGQIDLPSAGGNRIEDAVIRLATERLRWHERCHHDVETIARDCGADADAVRSLPPWARRIQEENQPGPG